MWSGRVPGLLRGDTSNEVEYNIADGLDSDARWLLEDECVGPLTVEIDLSWRQDALDLN